MLCFNPAVVVSGVDHSVPDYRLSITSVNGFKGNAIPLSVRFYSAEESLHVVDVASVQSPDGSGRFPGAGHALYRAHGRQ